MGWLLWADVAGSPLFEDLPLLFWTRLLGPFLVVTLLIVNAQAYMLAVDRRDGRRTFTLQAMFVATALAAVCFAVCASGSGIAILGLVAWLAVLPWVLFARR